MADELSNQPDDCWAEQDSDPDYDDGNPLHGYTPFYMHYHHDGDDYWIYSNKGSSKLAVSDLSCMESFEYYDPVTWPEHLRHRTDEIRSAFISFYGAPPKVPMTLSPAETNKLCDMHNAWLPLYKNHWQVYCDIALLLDRYNCCLSIDPVDEANNMKEFLHCMTPDQAVLWDAMQEIIAARITT